MDIELLDDGVRQFAVAVTVPNTTKLIEFLRKTMPMFDVSIGALSLGDVPDLDIVEVPRVETRAKVEKACRDFASQNGLSFQVRD